MLMQSLLWILSRAKEPSTWRGLVVLASSLGIALSPQQADAIVVLGLSLVGAIEVFRKEK